MKTKLLALVIVAALLGGCATNPGSVPLIQRALDAALPADFRGDLLIAHRNPYLDGKISAGNLRREAGGWVWDWLEYERNGRFSQGEIKLGTRPK